MTVQVKTKQNKTNTRVPPTQSPIAPCTVVTPILCTIIYLICTGFLEAVAATQSLIRDSPVTS